ncbi:helix-turn-helix domain-containing protein [Natrononativus amylolyticus]|uniref:helix-turn-helix domain-containing protein n=1 Tax=Natrononativus amylolyticus TaxID=2963434 RepID=UPI0020CDEB8D|nr:helix-turn-helix domain-containing protein [Natrononativus amylolyticus]
MHSSPLPHDERTAMIIAEYTLDHPILRQTLRDVPGLEVRWEDSYADSDGRMRMLAWFDCDDVEAAAAALEADSTVAQPTVLAEAGGRRLYRFELVGEGAQSSIMPVLVEGGGVHQELVGTRDGWRNRTRFPDREAFERVFQFCQTNEIGFTFDRIYELSNWPEASATGLSDAQLETLVEAVRCGYLDIPRRSSLAELGELLGISESAASERFRRGVKTLIQETVDG